MPCSITPLEAKHVTKLHIRLCDVHFPFVFTPSLGHQYHEPWVNAT